MILRYYLAIVLTGTLLVGIDGALAHTYPILPAVGEVFHVGGLCRTTWATQNGPGWRTTKIQLMSGIETPILNIADDIDCTKSANSIVFRCPDVTKYGEAYFFRYINNDEPMERTYSARFVITKKFRTKGVVAATTEPVTLSTKWRGSDNRTSTVTYANGTLSGTATKTHVLPKSAWETGKGEFPATIKAAVVTAGPDGKDIKGGGGGGEGGGKSGGGGGEDDSIWGFGAACSVTGGGADAIQLAAFVATATTVVLLSL